MEVSGVVYRSLPSSGFDDHSVLSSFKPSRVVGFSNRVGDGNLRFSGSRVRKYAQSGFSDAGYLKYYSNSRRPEIIICGGGANIDEEVKDEKKKKKKLMKKRSKLLKALSQNVDFGLDPADNRHALLDQIKGNMMSDATELLITQLRQQLKAEEKALKRKRKEVKARKKAELMKQNSEGASSSSSSSSSESSDSECGEVVDMTRLKNQVLAPPVVNESESTPVSSTGRDIVVENQLRHEELDSVSRTNNVAILGASGSCCDQPSVVAENKIEVCMGGKCKKSGAALLIEEFNKVLGSNVGGSVVGCKCMGKCRSAPNVRVLNSSTSSSEAQTDPQGTPTKSLCIGVGLDDVSTIVANLLGQTHTDNGGFAASAASWSGAM